MLLTPPLCELHMALALIVPCSVVPYHAPLASLRPDFPWRRSRLLDRRLCESPLRWQGWAFKAANSIEFSSKSPIPIAPFLRLGHRVRGIADRTFHRSCANRPTNPRGSRRDFSS